MNPKSARIPAPTISALEMQEEHFWNLSLLTDSFLTSLDYAAPLEPAPWTVMLSARRTFCEGIFPKLPPYMAYSASHSKQGSPSHSSDGHTEAGTQQWLVQEYRRNSNSWPRRLVSHFTFHSSLSNMEFKDYNYLGKTVWGTWFKETQEATAPLLYGKHVKMVQVRAPEAVMKLLVDT